MKVTTSHFDMKTQTQMHDESQDMKSDDDDISTASNSEHTQSFEADGSESGSRSEVENESDPWESFREEAKERNVSEYEEIQQNFIERGLDEESASSQAYSLILPKLQKDLERIYLECLFWMRQLRKNRVHRKVMNTRDSGGARSRNLRGHLRGNTHFRGGNIEFHEISPPPRCQNF